MKTSSSAPDNGRAGARAHLEQTIIESYYLAFDLWELSRQEGFLMADETRTAGNILLMLARKLSKKMVKGALYSQDAS